MSLKPIKDLDRLNKAGLSDSMWSGVEGSFYKLVGLDMHSEPGITKAEQKLTKDSGATVDEFVKEQVISSNGRSYHFSSTSGKIWERDSGGSWTLVHTTTPAAGAALCLGAYEYQGIIYWATQSRLHRILASDAEGAVEWAANVDEDFATFDVTDAVYHPMIEQNLILYIGDGNQVAQVEETTFSSNALDIKTPLRISALGKIGTDLLIGTFVDDNITKTELIRWNTWSVSFDTFDTIDEVGIRAFIPSDNLVYVYAGISGNIYTYDGIELNLFKKVPAVYSSTATAIVHPDATAVLNGNSLFGVSNVSGDPVEQGVYRLGRNSRNYSRIMDLPYPISERSGGSLVLSGIEIGSIEVIGQKILVSWKNGSTYGVDLLDESTKLDGAYFETRVMQVDRTISSQFAKFEVAYNDLPASTDIDLGYKLNYAASYTTVPTDDDRKRDDTKHLKMLFEKEGLSGVALQAKVSLTTNSNDSPSIERLDVYVNE